MMWFYNGHLSVMLFSPACFNLCYSVFPNALKRRLKSIILPSEMCFHEQYMKPQISAR